MGFLEDYYSHYDEEGRLLSRHGQVEYLTTMKYIRESLEGVSAPHVLEVGGWDRTIQRDARENGHTGHSRGACRAQSGTAPVKTGRL